MATDHELRITENQTTRLRTGTCTCERWTATEPVESKPGSIESNFDLHLQRTKK